MSVAALAELLLLLLLFARDRQLTSRKTPALRTRLWVRRAVLRGAVLVPEVFA
jgi:hypothetical protein